MDPIILGTLFVVVNVVDVLVIQHVMKKLS